jgi:hypothetical protein
MSQRKSKSKRSKSVRSKRSKIGRSKRGGDMSTILTTNEKKRFNTFVVNKNTEVKTLEDHCALKMAAIKARMEAMMKTHNSTPPRQRRSQTI